MNMGTDTWKGILVIYYPRGGQPGKVYHVRNVITRENLITCRWTNELAHALLTEYTQLRKLYDWQNETRWHYATSPGSMESYGERTQTDLYIWKSHQVTPLPGKLTTVHPGEWLLRFYWTPRWPFLGFAQALSASIVWMNLPEQAPTHGNVYCWLHNYVHGCTSTMCLRSIKPSLPFLYPLCLSYYVTHMINYSRPSTAFLYCKRLKAGQDFETRCYEHHYQKVFYYTT